MSTTTQTTTANIQSRTTSALPSVPMQPCSSCSQSYEQRHAVAMAYATRNTAAAQREAAARQLEEGELFVQMLAHRLNCAQRRLAMAEDQVNTTKKLVASDATSPRVSQRLYGMGPPDTGIQVRGWGSEAATTPAGDDDIWLEE